MCNGSKTCKTCNANLSGMKKKKGTRRRRSASVGGIKMQPVKGLLNLPTGGAAVGTVLAINSMVEKAKPAERAILRSKDGAKIMALGGGLGAVFIPGNGLVSKIARGVALGAAAHGLKVLATDEDWGGNAVTAEKMDAVAGVPVNNYLRNGGAVYGTPVNSYLNRQMVG